MHAPLLLPAPSTCCAVSESLRSSSACHNDSTCNNISNLSQCVSSQCQCVPGAFTSDPTGNIDACRNESG